MKAREEPLEIQSVKTKAQKKAFVDLPWKIYNRKDHPQWVPPLRLSVMEALDTKKNPFYKRATLEMFLATRGKKVVGRIAAIENRAHNEFYKDKVGFFGFFECEDNPEIARALFGAAESWLTARGFSHMRGPVNPSTNHECGLLVRGQSQHPTIMTTWNPKYYEALYSAYDLKGVKDLVAYFLPTNYEKNLTEHTLQKAARASSQFTFRDFDMKNFERDVGICYDIYNSAWESNWGFFPMTREEFFHSAKDMKMVLDPRFAFIAEKDGKPAGFMLALPDLNHVFKRIRNGKLFPTGILKLLIGKRLVKSVRILTLGVKEEFRRSGIFSLFTQESFERARKYKVVAGEASWILEDNVEMNKPWKDIGAPLYRRWRIFEKELPPSVG